MAKKLLLFRACGIVGEDAECDNIRNQIELFGVQVTDLCPSSNDEIFSALNATEKYDYIYLSSHGNQYGFGNNSQTIYIQWSDFASAICESDCLNDDSIILLSCCRGGLNQVAYTFFKTCEKLSYIVGPRQSLYPSDMLIGFSLFFYNIIERNVDPIVACEKIWVLSPITTFSSINGMYLYKIFN